MAKIYETKDDYKRDVLKDQAADMRLAAEKKQSSGLGFIGVGLILDTFPWNRQKSDWVKMVSGISTVVGFAQAIQSYFMSHKAHNLELQAQQMGPQHIVLPPDVDVPNGKDCGCKFKDVQSRSLLQHAAKSSNTTIEI